MMKRKAHSKSRKGCHNCKRRHVKCDEQGPPCLNCVVRETHETCTYAFATSAQKHTGRALVGAASVGKPGQAASDALTMMTPSSTQTTDETHSSLVAAAVDVDTEAASCVAPETAEAAENRRLMEIELMHRWSTVTYKSFVSVAEDHDYLQAKVPLEAVRHPYLLDGLLAVTALEKALTEAYSEPADDRSTSLLKVYINAGLEYYGKAVVAFREKLSGTTGPEDQHPLYLMSLVAPLINLVIPRCLEILNNGKGRGACRSGDEQGQQGPEQLGYSAIAQAHRTIELLNGMASIVRMDWGAMMTGPVGPSIAAALRAGLPDMDAIDADADAALNKLMALAASIGPPKPQDGAVKGQMAATRVMAPAEHVISIANYDALIQGRVPVPIPEAQPSMVTPSAGRELRGEAPARSRQEQRRDMYMNEVFYLRYSFAEAERGAYKFSGLGWPCTGGREFAAEVARREPLALLLLAFWAVVMGRESNSAWWTGSIGADMVAEISEALVLLEMRGHLDAGLAAMAEWKECLSWTRTQVGLPALS